MNELLWLDTDPIGFKILIATWLIGSVGIVIFYSCFVGFLWITGRINTAKDERRAK